MFSEQHRAFFRHFWSPLTKPSTPSSWTLSMSTWMMIPGCKPPSQLGQGESGSAEKLSWNLLPTWPLLLAVQSWFIRSFLLPHLTTWTHSLRLLLTRGGKGIPNFLLTFLSRVSRGTGMLPGSRLLSWMVHANQLSQARLLSVSHPESGAWLNALPISLVGLRIDDEVIRIAVGAPPSGPASLSPS